MLKSAALSGKVSGSGSLKGALAMPTGSADLSNYYTKAEVDEAAQAIYGEIEELATACRGLSTLIVTPDGNYASHTPKEIYDHVQRGGMVVFKTGTGAYFQLNRATELDASFIGEDLAHIYMVVIENDKFILEFDNEIPSGDNYYILRDRVDTLEETVDNLPVYDGTYREIYAGEVEDV